MPEEKETSLIPLTPEELDAAASEVFDKEQPSEPDPALQLINDRLELSSDQNSYREKFLRAAGDNDWRRKIPALAKECFETLHRLEEQESFLRWYGHTYPDLTAGDPWFTQNIERIAFLKHAAPDDVTPIASSTTSLAVEQVTEVIESETKDQIPTTKIFKGDTESSKLKRIISARYISHHPTQAEMVAWLQSLKPPKPILRSWRENFDLVDWMDAFQKRPDLVKRYLSGITGKLRDHGYKVGRT